jgi:thioredoxin-dependent peroxiredoxin
LFLTLLARVRILSTTATAIAAGLMTTLSRSEPAAAVTLRPGDRAPEFALAGSDGRTYRLSEFVGRRPVVLAWFPKAFTGGCTTECKSISLSSARLRALDAACFAVSVDDRETNREFAAYLGSDLPILSDPDKSVARAYGVMTTSGFPARWTFYIGKDGRILAIDKHVRTATHGADITSTLDSMKAAGQG